MRRLLYLAPVALFGVLALFFLKGLTMNPRDIPSVLINRPVPEMNLAPLPGRGEDTGLATADLKGRVSLVNIYGSWCIACVQEHPFLVKIKQMGIVPIHGIDWRDDPAEGAKWLKKHGDPYDRVGVDPAPGRTAIDFGVTGAPETFVVDKAGIIRYKHIGPVNQDVWDNTLLPIIKELSK
ncbi:DsbE family thiol:disulfide interchange protein [Magnetospirillum sp. 64-120]|uniref:DsbE family thiol:disulfide interchange protein n=1 Tax=Magnetospirillum sp. 64-120 TaxID=1895778 RepID=UPI00092C6A2E|nr:DsbE family thiol:disulfide interchange protein [Magnetospirillum sp. 64-120]OJX81738.1 MAG: thiol:disulfide interchange protein [Magnetospirillum sp. 64-120]